MRTLIEKVLRVFLEDAAVLRWTAFSIGSFGMVLGLTALCHEVLHLGEQLAFLIPLLVAVLINFLVCRYFVYRSTQVGFFRQLIEFIFSTISFRGSEYLAYVVLCDLLHVWYIHAVLIIMPISFVVKFAYFKLLVFRAPRDVVGTEAT